ncbi:hypothetical protein [Microbulbifer magnicolonia]|uniref:hypothetical protein n=1 Tax=Microbulbifer magnicolonia TaxID=3109744 RepID=UPI002B40162C|nr:hypothetical protein [Microbulbifer sp. GG15]
MSSFTCKCGAMVRETEERPNTSGILLSLTSLAALEEQMARSVVAYLSTPEDQREAWLRVHFGPEYPKDLAADEVANDIISQSVNAANFSSSFRCPKCGRLAVAPAPERESWSFFAPE